jgi:hypothetical protein
LAKNLRFWPDILPATAAALAGAVVAAVCLVFKPVMITANPVTVTVTVTDAGDTADSREIHYIQGSRDRAAGATWVRKRAALLAAAPGEIAFNEDELNAWFAASTHARAASTRAASTRADRRAAVAVPAGQLDFQLNFRIAGACLQIAAPVTVQTPFGQRTVIVQTRGVFERIPANPNTDMPDLIMYAPRETYAGSLPLHRIPGVTAWLINGLLESQMPPGEALAAWRKIDRVTITGRELRITISGAPE